MKVHWSESQKPFDFELKLFFKKFSKSNANVDVTVTAFYGLIANDV